MFDYRITKYNPKNRDENGWYIKDEWTDYSCVNEIIAGKKVTFEEYEYFENLYIQAIHFFLEALNLEKIKLIHPIKNGPPEFDIHTSNSMKKLYHKVHDGIMLSENEITDFLKLRLRSHMGGKLLSDQGLFINWGYDYYMYVATLNDCDLAIKKIKALGLFPEEHDIYDMMFPEINLPITDPWIEIFREASEHV
jgi:hypothetical protein